MESFAYQVTRKFNIDIVKSSSRFFIDYLSFVSDPIFFWGVTKAYNKSLLQNVVRNRLYTVRATLHYCILKLYILFI